jgi:ribonuclease P protein component
MSDLKKRNQFPKREHLYGDSAIEHLYEKGDSFFLFPYRVTLARALEDETEPLRILVSVSKKRFKHAVDRNCMKRRMREAYRLNKHSLYEYLNKKEEKLYVGIQFVGTKLEASSFLRRKMSKLLSHLLVGLENGRYEL